MAVFGILVLHEAPGLRLTGLVILHALCQSKYHFFMEENSENLLAPSEGAFGRLITFSNTEKKNIMVWCGSNVLGILSKPYESYGPRDLCTWACTLNA